LALAQLGGNQVRLDGVGVDAVVDLGEVAADVLVGEGTAIPPLLGDDPDGAGFLDPLRRESARSC